MRTFIAALFSLVFILLLLLTTLALSLRSFVFNANFYVATLKSLGVFQRLEQDPLGFIDLSEQIPQLAAIPQQLQQQVLMTILPPDWLEKQTGNAVQAWLTWFVAGEGGSPEIPIDLRQIRDRLRGPPGLQAATEVVNAIPTCTPDQQPQLSFTQLPECIPAVFDRSAVAGQAAQLLSDAASRMPAEYDIGPRIGSSVHLGLTFNGQRISGMLIDTLLVLLALITIGVWLMGGLIGGHSGRERWFWLGGSLFVGSLIVLGAGLFNYVFGPRLLPASAFAGLANEGSLVVRGVAQAMVQQLALRSILVGVVLFIVALMLLGVGLVQGASQRVVAYRS